MGSLRAIASPWLVAEIVGDKGLYVSFELGVGGFTGSFDEILNGDASRSEGDLKLVVTADAFELAAIGLGGDGFGGCGGEDGAGDAEDDGGGDGGECAGDGGIHGVGPWAV